MTDKTPLRLTMQNVGPIRSADVTFGDLTVIVGPQATGKSIFLQTLKLVLDRPAIHDTFKRYNVTFNGDASAFLGGYFGKGMAAAWREESSRLSWEGVAHTLPDLARPSRAKQRDERLFLIPAQRVMGLSNGVTQHFGQFNYGDPFALRYFSDKIHDLVQNELGAKTQLFPQPNRLDASLRKPIEQHLFGGSRLALDAADFTKRLVLQVEGHAEGLPYTAWSAGQREFTPLLLGMYWLCPAGGVSRREQIEWVVIEEPEMGLHPQGIEAVLLLVLDLMKRGYRVVLATHSPTVLDLVWALQEIKAQHGQEKDIRQLLGLPAGNFAKNLTAALLEKTYKVYFFDRDAPVQDISRLDPGADSEHESLWGGLVGFSSRVGEVVAKVASRAACAALGER